MDMLSSKVVGDDLMKTQTLTLAVEEDLLHEARIVAARHQTSLEELVRESLRRLLEEEQQRWAAWDRIRPLVEEPPARIGGPLPSRDEIHER